MAGENEEALVQWCRDKKVSVFPDQGRWTLEYGGRQCGNPNFPGKVQAHGDTLAEAVETLRLWITKRASNGGAFKDYTD